MAGLSSKCIAVKCSKLQTSPVSPKGVWTLLLHRVLLSAEILIFEMISYLIPDEKSSHM